MPLAAHRLRALLLAGLAVAVVVAIAVVAWPRAEDAGAAFPGANGKIAFSRGAIEGSGIPQVFVMNSDGTAQTKLTSSLPAGSPSWSADGTRITFDRYADGFSDIFVMNADGTGQTNLTNSFRDDLLPAWSPDGSMIAFVSLRDGNYEIYVMNSDGSGQTRITNDAEVDYRPAWSPDGTRIAFTSHRDGDHEIYVMNTDGTDLVNLTNNVTDDQGPNWSPDGGKIAFGRFEIDTGTYDVYVMNADGSGQTRLTTSLRSDFEPAWSPDGTKIAFSSNRDGNYRIFVMNSDGSGQTPITNGANDDFPDWQPLSTATPTSPPTATPTPTPNPIPRMQKLPPLQNLWLTRQGTKIPPVRCLDSTDVATLTESISVPVTGVDPKDPSQARQLGGFSFQVTYDPLKVCVDLTPGPAWTAHPAQICTIEDSVSAPTLQGVARMNCVTLGKATLVDTSTAAGRVLATITVRPQPGAYSQSRASQDNGQVVQLNNESCKLTDLQGHAIEVFSCEDADVTVRYLEGDVEPDCAVNTLDTQAIAFRWGAGSGSLIYNSRFDVSGGGGISVNDLQFVYGRYGSTCAVPWPAQVPVKAK